ncbi:MAG: glycosyltransferase family 4 protein [Planctomycetota bacterium]|jgi:glycosyltransferase involved in cell wall biosynthesis
MIVGLDVRPALYGRSGFGRVARELLGALAARPGLEVRAYGAAWRRVRHALPARAGRLRATSRRLPARLQHALAPLGFSVETLLGPLDVFQHTDLVFAPVRRAREVLIVHDLLFLHGRGFHDEGFRRRVEPRLRRRAHAAAAVVVPSDRVAQDVVGRGLAPPGRVHVVAWGCDHVDPGAQDDDAARVERLLREAGVDDLGRPLVLAPGTREPRKNHAALLEACRALPGHAATLVLAGARGWGCEDLEARLAEPATRGRCAVLGEVSEADLAALLRRADVVAYPSLAEGFGLPVAEAMRCGRAVLTSADSPMADLGGDAVLAVPRPDAGSLGEALGALLADAPRREALGQAARERVAALTWDRTAAALHALYQTLPGCVDSGVR